MVWGIKPEHSFCRSRSQTDPRGARRPLQGPRRCWLAPQRSSPQRGLSRPPAVPPGPPRCRSLRAPPRPRPAGNRGTAPASGRAPSRLPPPAPLLLLLPLPLRGGGARRPAVTARPGCPQPEPRPRRGDSGGFSRTLLCSLGLRR